MVPEFLMDKYEVSNKLYKAFMDAGGYSNKKFLEQSHLCKRKRNFS